jgi:hypothetical protein
VQRPTSANTTMMQAQGQLKQHRTNTTTQQQYSKRSVSVLVLVEHQTVNLTNKTQYAMDVNK